MVWFFRFCKQHMTDIVRTMIMFGCCDVRAVTLALLASLIMLR